MSSKLFTMFLLVLFVATLTKAQEKSKVLVDDFNVVNPIVLDKTVNTSALSGEPIGVTTDYDYFSNSIIRDQIVWDATLGTPHLLNMIRPWQGVVSRRVVHSYKSGGSWINNDVVGAAAGWPHIDLGLTGDGEGVLAGVFHNPSRFFIWDGSTGYSITQFDPSTDPSLQISGANVYLATSGGRAEYKFYKTEDFGVTFTLWDSISSWSPLPMYWTANGGVEVGMSKSPNEQFVVYFGTNKGAGHVYNGIRPDSADNVWAIISTDAGATWTGKRFGEDGTPNIVSGYHTPRFAPLFENFGQMDLAVGNNGVMHVLFNGYGLYLNAAGDSALGSQFPVLYYNSSTQTWKSISDRAIDTISAIVRYYPTNSIGQAYPSISVSENGQVLYALWTGPQLNATGGLDTADNTLGTMYYWRDLYHAFSTNGGQSWTYGGKFPGMQNNISEVKGHATQHLEFVPPNIYRAHIVYLADLTTGVGPFDGVLTNNPIIYTTFDIMVSSIDGNDNVPNSFALSQNYPNPFNPSTTINYSLAERSNVTIKVFDMLGREVANLVNTVQEAGSHSVNFDASNLSTGMYVYTINAGNFTSSKKMMLLK